MFITKLLNNFRSHRSLLTLPSKEFYESELRPRAGKFCLDMIGWMKILSILIGPPDPMLVDSMLDWPKLPKKGFPMIFHSVVGVDKRESRSPSFFNVEEVCVVIDYVKELLSTPGKMKVIFC